MAYQAIFKRFEIKYMLSREQKEIVLKAMAPYMALDKYGRTTIRNIYYDTDNYLLIRRSIEKPIYKEKLRIRSYQQANKDDPVFVELKKKFNGIVYKRRISLPQECAMEWIKTGMYPFEKCQISNEIDYCIEHYKTLKPAVFLSYEREAYYDINGSDFRVTFDENIISRREELSLEKDVWGTTLLDEEYTLMEIKTSGGMPLWMTKVLTDNHIFKASFSKYGNVYLTTILSENKGGILYA